MIERTLKLALLMTVAACSGPSGAGTAPAAAKDFCRVALERMDTFLPASDPGERQRGTVVGAGTADLNGGMNPFATSLVASVQHQLHVNLMSLVRLDEQLKAVPYLADSWQLSEDGTVLEFRLRDDVFWHDGVPTTAQDVAFTYERASDPASQFPNPAYFRFYEGVEVVDDRTVRFHVRPHGELLETWAQVPILPAHLLADVPVAELADHPYGTRCPVGNGPFRFVEHREEDRWIFAANPRFPAALGGAPRVDSYVFRVIPDQTTLLTELLAGSLHVYFDVRPGQVPAIEASDQARLLSTRSREFAFIGWNSRRAHLSDPAVRRALTQAIDRHAIVDRLMGGYARVAESSVPPFHWGYDPAVADVVGFDPAAARRALAAAGWVDRDGDGVRENEVGERFEVEMLSNQGNQLRATIAQIVQADLAAVGVAVRPSVLEMGTLASRVMDPEGRDFDALILSYQTDFRIDDADLFHSDRIDGGLALAGTHNPAIDALIDALPLIVDRAQARRVWAQYQQALVEEQPFTYLYFPDVLMGVSRRLRNVEVDERGAWYGIHDWSLDSATAAAVGGR